jgi:hypothetical protein
MSFFISNFIKRLIFFVCLILSNFLWPESVEISQKKVLICGPIKNGEQFFSQNTEDIERIGGLFNDYRFIIFENDSRDLTHQLYKNWANENKKVIFLSESLLEYSNFIIKNLNGDLRTEIISQARNKILQEAYKEIYCDFDYLIMLDLDGFTSIDENLIKQAIENPEEPWDAIFANGSYDLYALRSKKFPCGPESLGWDLWQENLKNLGIRFANELKQNKWIKVDSAYGGLAIYQLRTIRGTYYSGIYSKNLRNKLKEYIEDQSFNDWGNLEDVVQIKFTEIEKFLNFYKNPLFNIFTCEHILFHLELQKKGYNRFYVDPRLIRNSLFHKNYF